MLKNYHMNQLTLHFFKSKYEIWFISQGPEILLKYLIIYRISIPFDTNCCVFKLKMI